MFTSDTQRRFARWLRGLYSPAARAILLFWLLQLGTTSAFAHAALIATSTSDGVVLQQAPAEITLRFSEPVAPLVFKLVLPNGSIQPVMQITTTTDGLKATLPRTTARGSYVLSWRVVSGDGHPVGGTLGYSVGVASGEAATSTSLVPASARSVQIAIWLTRFGLYCALFIGIGATLFRAFTQRPMTAAARWNAPVLWLGLALLPLALGAQGLDALALPWRALATLPPWKTALGTAYGSTILLMLAALSAALLANRINSNNIKSLALIAVLLLGGALAASGHASSARPVWLARPAVLLHAIMITAWIGSLLPLLQLVRGTGANRSLLRFSRLMPWVLALLLISGVTLTLLQLDHWAALWQTDYGRILSAKLVVVALLLAVAAWNRYRLTARVQRGEARAQRVLARLIRVELLLVVIVLALVSTWRFTPPPRALDLTPSAPINLHLHDARAMLDLSLIPQPGRRFSAKLFVQSGDFSPLQVADVTLEFSNPALGIQPIRETAQPQTEGAWIVPSFALPVPGRWQVRVRFVVSDFERVELEQDVNLAF